MEKRNWWRWKRWWRPTKKGIIFQYNKCRRARRFKWLHKEKDLKCDNEMQRKEERKKIDFVCNKNHLVEPWQLQTIASVPFPNSRLFFFDSSFIENSKQKPKCVCLGMPYTQVAYSWCVCCFLKLIISILKREKKK